MSIIDKARTKIGGAIDAATDKLDDLTGGKTVMLSAKVDAVAHKIAGGTPGDEHDEAGPGDPADADAAAHVAADGAADDAASGLDEIDDDTLYDDGLDDELFSTETDDGDGVVRIVANLD